MRIFHIIDILQVQEIYLVPPVLSLLVSLSLAGIAIHATPRTTERRLFSVICLWWGLLSPAFICHHLLTDSQQILAIERTIHFFYVFLPALHILFVHHLLEIRNKPLVIGAFLLSGLLAATTPTDIYIYGLYQYDWGYIAKGGPAFQLFGLYGMATIVYIVFQTRRRLRREDNVIRIRKQKYIIFSFCLSGSLTLMNIPSMNGYDLYPAGNFLFLPLSILAYGVLKYRLMAIRSILLQTAFWLAVSSLILVPNIFFLLWSYEVRFKISPVIYLALMPLWFLGNYFYVRRLQPAINRRFHRSRNQLNHVVKKFIANAAFLRDLQTLVAEFQDLMQRYLAIPNARIFLCAEASRVMRDPMTGASHELSGRALKRMEVRPFSLGMDMIDTHPAFADVAVELLGLLEKNNCRYLVPLLRAERLTGVALMPRPEHGADLSPDELKLLDQLTVTGLAFSNSAILKNMADLKQDLEKRTHHLSVEIEQRQRIEKALRKSEEKHRLMAENIEDVIWTSDLNLSFTYISPAVTKMQGWAVDDFMAASLTDVMPAASIEKAQQAVADAFLEGEQNGDFSRHVTLLLKQFNRAGETLQTEVAASFMLDEHGRPYGILGVTRDITTRMQAIKEREELQQQLARSKKMEALGMLAGSVAHDLNNILSGIVSYPELIMRKLPEDSTLLKPLQTIRRSGQRAAAVVDDLVTISRGVASSHEVTSLNRLVKRYLASPEHADLRARYPDAQVDICLAPELRNMRCSVIHIEKVLMNLVANAVESLDMSGCVNISTHNRILDRPIRGHETIRAGEYTMLRISDTGSGIPPEDLDRIFEPFFTKKVMGRSGTGLGLAIVWNTMQDHDGYITVDSGPGGTRFDLYFPSTHATIASGKGDSSIDAFRGNGETILIVDDDPTQRLIASEMLSFLGYRVDMADSGEAAVAHMQRDRADLLLLDMIMPQGMNGRETYEAVVRIRPEQKAIIASGFSQSDEVKEAQRMGVGRLLKKPYTIQKLGQAVASALALSTTGV